MKEAEDNGQFSYIPVQLSKDTTDDDDIFDDADEIPIQSTTKVQNEIESSLNNLLLIFLANNKFINS